MMMNDFESNTLLRDAKASQSVIKEPKTLRVLQIFVQGKKLKNLDGVRDKSDT
jgi:hypothetical protein